MPKKTVETIVAAGNDYVIQVKGNQPKLKAAVEDIVKIQKSDDQYATTEINRGRKENRAYYIYENVSGGIFEQWKGLQTVILLRSSGIRNGKPYQDIHYYISSRVKTSAKTYGVGIRRHWRIENNQHWVKDVIMYEDKSMIKGKSLAKTLSLIRSIVMNIYRTNNLRSIKGAIENNTNRIGECLNLIENSYILKI